MRYAWTAPISTIPAYELTNTPTPRAISYKDDSSTAGITEGFGLMFYNARWLRSVSVTKWDAGAGSVCLRK
ncbi:MAG: hypothetical protein ACOYYF_03505 [Chloroflexota bacterium]|nr:hypothetical protein [Chloroflexota bacterium]MBI5703741.1 hypothetical protein [Chloroflexota bacterium]